MAPPLCPATAAAAAAARAAAHPGLRSPCRPRREGRPKCDYTVVRGARSPSFASLRPAGWTVRGRSVAAAPLSRLRGGRSGPSGRRRSLIPRHTQVRAGGGPGCLEALPRGGSGLGLPGGSPARFSRPPAGEKRVTPLGPGITWDSWVLQLPLLPAPHSLRLFPLSREEPPRERCQAGGGRSFLSEIPPSPASFLI